MVGDYTDAEILLMRAKCDESLLYFTRVFFKETENKKFKFNWHHKDLCKHFEDFGNYKMELLNINIPPRCSKTLIMMMQICRTIGMRHSSNSLYITASDNLRKKTTTDIRRILTSPLFKRMYGLEITKDQNSKDVIGFVGGGSLTTASIFGQIIGFGAGEMTDRPSFVNEEGMVEYLKENKHLQGITFEGGIYCDDLNKIKDSEAQNANNDAVTDVMFNTVFSRKNSSDTPIANIQQRAGQTDVTAALMDYYGVDKNGEGSSKARFVIMPVIYPDGRLLWEWRYPLDAIDKLKKSVHTAHIFETQYMQNPVPSGDVVFPSNKLNYFTMDDLNIHNAEYRAGAIDVADEGTDAFSFPSGVLIGSDFYVTDWLFTKENTEYTLPLTAEIIRKNKLDVTMVETNNHGAVFYKNLINRSNAYIGGVNNSADKHGRIIAESHCIRLNFHFRTDISADSDYAKAITELTRYTKKKGKDDDAPDSLALLAKVVKAAFSDRFY